MSYPVTKQFLSFYIATLNKTTNAAMSFLVGRHAAGIIGKFYRACTRTNPESNNGRLFGEKDAWKHFSCYITINIELGLSVSIILHPI